MAFRQFLRDRRGNIAILFALLIVPLLGFVGIAVDYQRAALEQTRMQQTADGIALRLATEGQGMTNEQLLARAQQLSDAYGGTMTVDSIVRTDSGVVIVARKEVPTTFIRVVGIDTVDVGVTAESVFGAADLEVALVLDITLSMAGSKIQDLRNAATNLVNAVVRDDQTPFYSKMALIPYSQGVNVGSLAASMRGAVTPGASISGAAWYTGSTRTISNAAWGASSSISDIAWSTGSNRSISDAQWSTGSARTITGATRANPVRISSNSHGFSNGDVVYISGINGMTQLNGHYYTVSNASTNYYYLQGVNGTNYSNYTSGGSARECLAAGCEVVVTTSSSHGFSTNDRVRVSGVSGMTQINNASGTSWPVTYVSSSQFRLGGSFGPSYGTYSGSYNDYAIECINSTCGLVVTTSSSHGFSTGNSVVISGVNQDYDGLSSLNSTWTITNLSSYSFLLNNTYGPDYNDYNYNGTASMCLLASCEVVVTTTSSHGFSTGDYIYINGVNGMGQINSGSGSSWTITSLTSNTFKLNGSGGSGYGTYSSGGTARRCINSTCDVQVTANNHGFTNGAQVRITGVNGMTQINNSGTNYWTIAVTGPNTFTLGGTGGTSYSNYTSGGTANCLEYGCEYYRFTTDSNGTRINQVSTCVSERTGANAYTDAAPGGSPVGMVYAASGHCPGTQIVPLTSDRDALTAVTNNLSVTGSTAGHIGAAWGWYLLSPNFASLLPTASQPASYEDDDVIKVVVLMTDGEFNTQFCNGVIDENVSVYNGSDRINCASPNGSSHNQALAMCAAMQDAGIIIYTVGFDLGNNANALEVMASCATSTDNAFIADNGEELNAAFASIGASISQLRLAR